MADIAEIEQRLAVALDRISRSLSDGPGPDIAAALAEAEAARDRATAEVAALKRETAAIRADAEAGAEAARAELVTLRQTLETERTAVAQLRERVAALKSAKDEQAARLAELEAEATRREKARTEDRAELDAIIAALEPLVAEGEG